MLDSMVDEIGEENVVQVVTDNGSNYVAAGKLLMAKREHLYWTPCAAHCIDLMLEDIGKIVVIKNTIKRSISLVGYIYSHGFTLNLLRTTTNKKELVRPAITRFATSYLSLQRLQEERENLRKMFTCDEWMQNKLSKEAKGIEATKTVMKTSFWNNVVYILKIMGPLVRVLRMVDGEKKAAMGYIYEAIEKAKEEIKKELNFDSVVTKGLYACINRLATSKAEEDRVLQQLNVYTNAAGDFFATWWSMFGKDTRLLQKFAIKILTLTCSASGCERNWSVFGQIHTKKRNRLEHKRMQDLVYVKYNQKLHDRNKLSATDEFDHIILDDIDECNEWLVGELDDDDDDIDGGNHLVHDDDDTLDWNMVYKASGVGEPRTYTRSKKRKESSTFSSSCLRVSKKKEPIIPRKGKGKRKRLALVDEESEEEEFEDSVSGDQEDEAMEDEDEMDADDSDDDELEDYVELDD
ncbi:uncharacterized protein LOC121757771 [Salvia splendens]|uniref:uncharacterized protein LOC121757771 n=1 Tax=Salvia splendens TaxID=180675 RepID=UPI001C25533A|nr:uncharacterized protein LOC121757771 [Salvia splendens]